MPSSVISDRKVRRWRLWARVVKERTTLTSLDGVHSQTSRRQDPVQKCKTRGQDTCQSRAVEPSPYSLNTRASPDQQGRSTSTIQERLCRSHVTTKAIRDRTSATAIMAP